MLETRPGSQGGGCDDADDAAGGRRQPQMGFRRSDMVIYDSKSGSPICSYDKKCVVTQTPMYNCLYKHNVFLSMLQSLRHLAFNKQGYLWVP